MWRALVLTLAVSGSAIAQPVTRPEQVETAKKPKPVAPKKKPKPVAKKRVAKKTVAKKRSPAAQQREARARITLANTKRVTVEQQSAQLKTVGRVTYGTDQMPPGFAWPPSQDMEAGERACEAELDADGIAWKKADPVGKVPDPIVVPSMVIGGIPYTSLYDKGPQVLDCQLVRMLARVAPQLQSLGVREVHFGSIYRNTLVRFGGVTGKALSRHALGFAMDITAFVDKDGQTVKVETDYPKHHALLLAIEDLIDHDKDFRILLTPKNDPISHHDHFHIEASVDFRPAQ